MNDLTVIDNLIKEYKKNGDRSWLYLICQEKLAEWSEFTGSTDDSITARYIETFDITEITKGFNKYHKTTYPKQKIIAACRKYYDVHSTDFLRWGNDEQIFFEDLNGFIE